jgi:PAS domain S-box-containing protein
LSAVGAAAGMTVTYVLSAWLGSQTVGAAVYVLWIAWLAVEFGIAGGLAGAVVAAGLFVAGQVVHEGTFSAADLASRGLPFLAIGLVIGIIAERLRASERTHRTFVEQLPLTTYDEPLDGGGSTYVSPQIERLTGFSSDRWIGSESLYTRLLHPEDRERVLAEQARAREAREPLTHEYRLVRADGSTVWVRDWSVALPGPRGGGHRQGFVVDVTREKEVEVHRHRLLTELQALIDATLDAICLTDRDGNVQIANEPMKRMARELDLPVDRPAHEQLLSIADRFVDPAAFRARIADLAATPDVPSRDEFEFAASRRVFIGFTTPVVGQGRYFGRVWTLREITAERELARLHEEFLSTVSHELRTPLTSISGFLELLADSAQDLGETERRYLETVDRNVARLRKLVDDLLLMRQVGAHRFSIERARLDLAAVVAEAVEAAGPAALASEIALTLEAGGTVPVDGDRARLAQVADNLIGNAVKFTPAGGHVQVEVSAQDGWALLIVADDGIGIPASQRARLFDPFFRASSATEQQISGTGLGLSIVKAIVEAHGGTVGVETEPGQGSTFRVELPLLTG